MDTLPPRKKQRESFLHVGKASTGTTHEKLSSGLRILTMSCGVYYTDAEAKKLTRWLSTHYL